MELEQALVVVINKLKEIKETKKTKVNESEFNSTAVKSYFSFGVFSFLIGALENILENIDYYN